MRRVFRPFLELIASKFSNILMLIKTTMVQELTHLKRYLICFVSSILMYVPCDIIHIVKMRNILLLFYIQLTFCQKNDTDSVFDLLVFDPRTKPNGGSISQINFSWFGPKMSEHVKVAQMKTPSEFDYDRTNMCSFQLFGKSYIIGGYGKGFALDI